MELEEHIAATIAEIKAMNSDLRMATSVFSHQTTELDRYYQLQELAISDAPPKYWRFVGVHDALSKFLEFCESDINSFADMELAQKARYFCDAIMWVKHLCDEKKNALEYYEHLLRGKRFHYEKVTEYLRYEITQLKKVQPEFTLALFKSTVRRIRLGRGRPTIAELEQKISEFDKTIIGRFSIYRRESSANYQLYAEHLESGVLAGYIDDSRQLELEIQKFEAVINRNIAKGHNSKQFAESLQMTEEYEFVFRLTSQHLHATPVSMSTQMRKISISERLIFIEYIRAKMWEALKVSLHLSTGFPKGRSSTNILGKYFSATRRQRPLRDVPVSRTLHSAKNL